MTFEVIFKNKPNSSFVLNAHVQEMIYDDYTAYYLYQIIHTECSSSYWKEINFSKEIQYLLYELKQLPKIQKLTFLRTCGI